MLIRTGRKQLERVLGEAGIAIGGNATADMRVIDERVYRTTLLGGSLGLGNAYMDGWWECERLDAFFERLLGHYARTPAMSIPVPLLVWLHRMAFRLLNLQRPSGAFVVGERHYDIGNDLFERMLDSRMNYSCAYWKDAEDLEAAQLAKLDLCCDKLELAEGMRVLDIGCGWGGAMRHMAERHGVHVTGVTVSERQREVAAARCEGLGEVHLQDYRDIAGLFDRVYSIGMFEHVGHRNYRAFMEKAHSLLKPDGLMLVHTIGANRPVNMPEPWLERHIFPNGMVPSMQQIADATDTLFVMEDWHNFGPDYARTLQAWHDNCEAAWDDLDARYDARFRRMWRYYLQLCMGAFRARRLQLWQVMLSPLSAPPRVYRAAR